MFSFLGFGLCFSKHHSNQIARLNPRASLQWCVDGERMNGCFVHHSRHFVCNPIFILIVLLATKANKEIATTNLYPSSRPPIN